MFESQLRGKYVFTMLLIKGDLFSLDTNAKYHLFCVVLNCVHLVLPMNGVHCIGDFQHVHVMESL